MPVNPQTGEFVWDEPSQTKPFVPPGLYDASGNYNDDFINQMAQNARLAQSDAPTAGGAFIDKVGSGAPDAFNTAGKFLGHNWKPSGPAMGIGIGGEILGALLKPKHDTANMDSPFAEYVDQYKRRMEGSGDGVLGGASKWGGRGAQVGSIVPGVGTAIGAGVGALAGAIGGLFTKNAKSAYTDFSVKDASQAIRDIYKNEGGRDVSDAEIGQILAGQGLKPGGEWVGEKGLFSVLDSLRHNFQAERGMQHALSGGR